MKTSNTFSIYRFGLLVRQDIIHNFKLLSISLIGFCGGLFILLLMIQIGDNFRPWSADAFFQLFLTIFIGTAILHAGTSFPLLRTKEKSYCYLLNPASAIEKFGLEFVMRIAAFILLVPLLYGIIFNAEGYVVHLLYPKYTYVSHSVLDLPNIRVPGKWFVTLIISCGLLIFTIPFAGATIFFKYPLVKTLFAVALIFFFHLFLVYFFIEILDVGSYRTRGNKILGMDGEQDLIRFLAIYSIIANGVLIAASFLKLKEREA